MIVSTAELEEPTRALFGHLRDLASQYKLPEHAVRTVVADALASLYPVPVGNKVIMDGPAYRVGIDCTSFKVSDCFFHPVVWTDAEKKRWREWRERTKNFHLSGEPWNVPPAAA